VQRMGNSGGGTMEHCCRPNFEGNRSGLAVVAKYRRNALGLVKAFCLTVGGDHLGWVT